MKQRAEISVGFESGVGGNVGYRLVCVNQPFLDLREPVLYYVFGDCHACVLLEYTAEMVLADIDSARYHIERQPAAVVLLDKFEHLFGSRVARRIRGRSNPQTIRAPARAVGSNGEYWRNFPPLRR